jgi:hypothetical protein
MADKKDKKKFPYIEESTVVEQKIHIDSENYWIVRTSTEEDTDDYGGKRGDAYIESPCGDAITLNKETYWLLRVALDKFFRID